MNTIARRLMCIFNEVNFTASTKNFFLKFCKLFDLNSFVTFVIYKCNDIMKEWWGSNSLQNLGKRHFCWNGKVHHIECTSSLVFFFSWSARFYPQYIINWQLQKNPYFTCFFFFFELYGNMYAVCATAA